MAKPNKFGYQVQKGSFQLVGKLVGVGGKNFYVEGKTKTNKTSRTLNVGVETDLDGNRVYVGNKAYSDVEVSFYSKELETTVKKPFKERNKFLETKEGIDGKFSHIQTVAFGMTGEKEDNKTVYIFDGLDELQGLLNNDEEVRVIGDIEYSSYVNGKGEKVSKRDYVLKRIYKSEVDMTKENYEPVNDFKQELIFMGIEKITPEDKEEKPYGEVSALIMQYSSLEKTTFRVYNPAIVKNLAKKVKPYTAMTVTGKLVSKTIKEETIETEDDGWGVAPKSYQSYAKRETYIEIVQVDPSTFDEEKFAKDEMEKILAEQAMYGKDDKVEEAKVEQKKEESEDDWGKQPKSTQSDDGWDF